MNNTLLRIIIASCLLGAAIISYSVGSGSAFGFFLLLGVVFEGGFWYVLFKAGRKRRQPDSVSK